MALYVALCYYDRDRYWDEPPETEFSPEYTEFARRATEAGVMRGGEAQRRGQVVGSRCQADDRGRGLVLILVENRLQRGVAREVRGRNVDRAAAAGAGP